MKYPYIGKGSRSGAVFLFLAEGDGLVLEQGFSSFTGRKYGIVETLCRNITAEYLANTYGEVKSKAHAEFIVKLATKNGIKVWNLWDRGKHFNFHTDQNGGLNLEFSNEEYAKRNGEKQITIPLPPERESVDEWPEVGSSVEWGHTGKGEVKSLSDGFAWIKLDNKDYTTVYISSLRKPKTPEQELRDFISLLWDENNHDFDMFLDIVTEHVIKKP